MAKSALKENLPSITQPIGSIEELERDCGLSGNDLRGIATCSEHDRMNYGCNQWDECERPFKGTRPQNEIYLEVKRNGAERIGDAPCFFVVHRQAEALDNGGLVEVIGGEGEEYNARGSVRRHPVKDPGCSACQEGKCTTFDDKSDLKMVCKPFPPAKDHLLMQKFVRSQRAAGERKRLLEARNRKALLGDDGEEPAVEVEGKTRGKKNA